jgi:ParB-like chromosome segregation protein Spo0J
MKTAKNLNPSQNEISRHRVEGLIEDDIIDKQEVPLLVSKNDYIVDGHHRWAAFRVKAPNKAMETIVVDAPIKDVLGIAIDWGAEHQAF